jgi:predicted nucleotidyltransferase
MTVGDELKRPTGAPGPLERRPADVDAFRRVLVDALAAAESTGVPFLVGGGVAASTLGRPRWSNDVDLVVSPDDACAVLDALADAGFETERTFPRWLFKGVKEGVLVDVMFTLMDRIHLDREMLEHAVERSFLGVPLRVVGPEDLVVIKAVSHAEHSPRHWWDAIGILAASQLDWEYLLERARYGPRRVLSLLVHADADDVLVPRDVIERLHALAYGHDAGAPR